MQEWTPERRKAASDRAKADYAAKRAEEPTEPVSRSDYEALLARFQELERRLPVDKSAPGINARGSLIGTFEKYIVDPSAYPDPAPRLAREPKLLRVPFKVLAEQNGGYYEYDLDFTVTTVGYETKDGVNTTEPRFTLKLNRFLPDDETSMPTSKAYTACQLVFHEDPQAALVIARENGYPVENFGEREFLDEMRYLRMRDWLLEAFYPVKPREARSTKQTVIGNRLVEVFEVTSQAPAKLDFSTIKQKL